MEHFQRQITLCLLGLMLLCSCAGGNGKKKASARQFPMPVVPAVLDQSEKTDYITQHFWDEFTDLSRSFYCDSLHVNGVATDDVEQAFANYVMLLEQLELPQARSCVKKLAERLLRYQSADSTSNMLTEMDRIVEHYLYDPNSPVRDEDLYTPYAEVMSKSALWDQAKRNVFDYQAEMTALNARGSRAADFSFSTAGGKVYTLHGIKADYTVLFFSNPGCTACKEIIDILNQEQVDALIDAGSLAVVNIYIDEDIQDWYAYMPVYSPKWYNGYDHNHVIRDDELYNVRAIPSLYLLDADKTVLLKDVEPQRLFAVMENLF